MPAGAPVSEPLPWPPGSATGVGSMPGSDAAAVVRTVLGELPDLPHLPELPARGPGADLVGRSAALLVDLHADHSVAGWRLVDRPGRDERRALGWLAEDLDRLEEQAAGWAGPLKVQVAGPWTLAASLELARAGRALGDPGACRDLAASLAEGVALHVADVRRRVPGAQVVVQVDEPSLPAVLAGRVPTVSGYGALAAVEPVVARAGLAAVLEAAAVTGAFPVVHCCAAGAPVRGLLAAGARAVSLDVAQLRPADDEALGEAVERGAGLFLGIVPATDAELSEPAVSVEPVRRIWRRLGFPPERLAAGVVLTPACGLAGASPAYSRTALAHVRAGARLLVDEPEG